MTHGTYTGYCYHRCRCELCKLANRRQSAKWRTQHPEWERRAVRRKRKKNRLSRQRTKALYDRRRKAGQCGFCGMPSSSARCDDCGKRYNESAYQRGRRPIALLETERTDDRRPAMGDRRRNGIASQVLDWALIQHRWRMADLQESA